jgi:Rrf2 family protein
MAWPDLPKQFHQSLKALCSLAMASGPLKAEDVAHLEEIPPAQTAKVLEHLTRAGFLQSRRGMKGGYWLAVSADRIRVGDVLASFGPRGRARRPKANAVTKAVRRITEPARKKFEELTIADISDSEQKELVRKGENADEMRPPAVT